MTEPGSLKAVFVNWVESSSVHGVPRIVTSTQIVFRCLWAGICVAASVVFTIQLITLINEYYSYPIKTSVNLKYHPIQFPAITFCNMNPVKRSKLSDYEKLLGVISPKTKTKAEDTKKTLVRRKRAAADNVTTDDNETESSESGTGTTTGGSVTTDKTTLGSKTTTGSSAGDSTSSGSGSGTGSIEESDDDGNEKEGSTYYYDYWATGTGSGNGGTGTNSASSTNWLNNKTSAFSTIAKNISEATEGAISASNVDESYVAFMYASLQSPKDEWAERNFEFQVKLINETIEDRQDIGHSAEDLVFGATYSGLIQNISNFQVYTTPDYGNCYTMASDKYQAWKSGPATGIQLTFNLEIDEYIRNFASGYGIRIVFHAPDTLPLPTEEGITLSPGFETNIGLRMVQVSRLGQPYGECSDGVAFQKKYKFKYTITACMQFCRVESIVKNCECFPSDGPDIALFNESLRVCDVDLTDRVCILAIDSGFSDGTFDCNCVSPCRDTVYEKTISGRMWPNEDYLLNVLMAEVCRRNVTSMKSTCDVLSHNGSFDAEKYKNNFLQLQIYFEDLNYENIKQEPMYEAARFLSDIGGALGLFMGGSLLSFVELPQLLLEIILYLYHHAKRSEEKAKHNQIANSAGNEKKEKCIPDMTEVHYLD